MCQVDGHVTIVDTFQKGVEHAKGHPRIALVFVRGIETGCIAGDTDNLTVQRTDLTSGLRRMYLLHLSGCLTNHGNVTLRIVIVGNYILQLRPVIVGAVTACAVKLHCRIRSLLATRMVEGLSFDIDIRGLRLPKHL